MSRLITALAESLGAQVASAPRPAATAPVAPAYAPPPPAPVAAAPVAAAPVEEQAPAKAPEAPKAAPPAAPKPAPAAPKPAPAADTTAAIGERYHAFVRNLPPRSQEFLKLVEERGTVTISEVMRALGLHLPKAMGGITGSIGRWAPVKAVPLPYEQLEKDGERAWRWVGIPGVTRGPHVAPPKPKSAPAVVAQPVEPAPTPAVVAAYTAPPSVVAVPPAPPPAPAPPPVVATPAPTPAAAPAPKAAAPSAPKRGPAARREPVVETKRKAPKAPPPPPPPPSEVVVPTSNVDHFLAALPDNSRQFMTRLRDDGSIVMSDALKMFSLNRPKALGGVLEPIRRIAREHGIEIPFEVTTDGEGSRVWYWPGKAPSANAAAEESAPKAPPPGVLRRKKG